MTFKRMMALGAVAAALAFTGCQDRSRSEQERGTGGSGYQTQPSPGSTNPKDSTIPGGSNTIGGTPQDARPGTELGGTGATGGSGMDTNTLPQDSLDEKNQDPNLRDQRNQLDDQENLGGTNDQAR